MKHRPLQAHFTYSRDGFVGHSDPADHSAPLRDGSYVFLAAGLDSYCSVLSARMDAIIGPDVFVPEQGPPAFDLTRHSDRRARPSASLAIILNDTSNNETTSRRVISLSTAFWEVIAPSLRLHIGYLQDGRIIIPIEGSAVEEFRRRMGPSLTCTKAAEWAFFERYEARKSIAESTAVGGELNLALAMYEDMLPIVSALIKRRLRLPPPPPRSCYAVRLLEADLLVTKAHIHYKLQDRAAFKRTIMLASMVLSCNLKVHFDLTRQPGTMRWITYLISMAHLDGDVVDMPLRCVDLRKTSDLARKPGYMLGWLDLKALSEIDEDYRTTINLVLRERGLPLAPFT